MRLEFARAGEHWMGVKKAYGTLGAGRGGYHAFLNRPKSSRQIAREALEPFVGGTSSAPTITDTGRGGSSSGFARSASPRTARPRGA